ncbi:UDP-glucose--hexose-1-phosphate uridylyltransferase [Cohnella massiliensis]|uniref:UDP-glucose--hexose-1-phosphate uridylyltransferase n=1 Tax=Cohnella massiliensis TaxID=1816691 RepID=UPI0009BBC51E|nr:UDP-glucose--hexose-1-phosphate uridylyltransferase [Cohnella massiliensis]
MNAGTTTSAVPESVGPLIERLVAFALHNRLLEPLDVEAARNALLDLFGLSEPAGDAGEAFDPGAELPDDPVAILEPLLDAAAASGLIPDDTTTYRDLFDARIMGLLMPRPSETVRLFRALAKEQGIQAATDWFYKLNIDSNYIRMDRIRKNGYWLQATEYGELEITVNLSKPEKDPKEIALLKTLPPAHYPKCLLCRENVGYAGRPDHPARQNLRVLPLELQGQPWFFQYSPYVYYNEHSIVFNGEHVPMRITPETFRRLLDFIERMPHYFIGSNADLPIVGGSILNHDHFQAGRHTFPMEKASVRDWVGHSVETGVAGGIVKWPMSVLRLRSDEREPLLRVADRVLQAWREYSDPQADIYAFTGETPHNTITPIARLKDGAYELDLVLRNNRASEEHPDGIFHPHRELHHIKKENIGLIEVMGLAVLPGRLKQELSAIADILTGAASYDQAAVADSNHPLAGHAGWIAELVREHGTSLAPEAAETLLRSAVGHKFRDVLRDAGVYKDDAPGLEAFARFLRTVGFEL